jgi:hypothetical protein
MKEIKITRRVTTTFLQAVPPQVESFDAFIYAVVKRKPGKDTKDKWGTDVRLDPCILDWDKKVITIHIPLNINTGIETTDDIDPDFYESVEAAFLTLMWGCIP